MTNGSNAGNIRRSRLAYKDRAQRYMDTSNSRLIRWMHDNHPNSINATQEGITIILKADQLSQLSAWIDELVDIGNHIDQYLLYDNI